MKLKYLALPLAGLFAAFFCLLLLVALLFAFDEDGGGGGIYYGGANLSAAVLAHRPMVERYAAQYGISEYVNVLLAIIQVESGGTLEDVMQSSESMGLPPNSLDTESSIRQGCKYFSELIDKADRLDCDLDSVIQAYNYGGGFLDYVTSHGGRYSFELAQAFAEERSGGVRVPYKNEISVAENGGWRYKYGNMFYVRLVSQYLYAAQYDNATVQAIMNEALKYQGWEYVYGGAVPRSKDGDDAGFAV